MKRIIGLIWLVLLAAIPACATVSTETTRVAYTCNGVLTSYAYTFKVLADADLLVIKKATATSAETTLALNTDYTVTGAGTSGGNVVLTAGSKCGSGYTLTILRNMAATQTTDYVDGEAFSAESLEAAIDKATIVLQQQKEQIGRAPKLPKTSTITDIALPNPTAGSYIGWNAGATGLENKSGTVITTATQYEVDALVSYGGGTAFTQATIEAALPANAAAGYPKITLLLRPGTWVFSSNADWSAYTNVTFKIVPGALISHGTFTVNIPNVEAGLYQIFSGAGAETISGNTRVVYPEWWGTGANTINSALAAHGQVELQVANYSITTQPTYTSGNRIIGKGKSKSVIILGADITPLLFSNVNDVDARDFQITTHTTQTAPIIKLSAVNAVIARNRVTGVQIAAPAAAQNIPVIKLYASGSGGIWNNNFEDISVSGVGIVVDHEVVSGGTAWMNNNRFEKFYLNDFIKGIVFTSGGSDSIFRDWGTQCSARTTFGLQAWDGGNNSILDGVQWIDMPITGTYYQIGPTIANIKILPPYGDIMYDEQRISDYGLNTDFSGRDRHFPKLLSDGHYLQIPTTGWTEGVTGSGVTVQALSYNSVNTGVTVSSTARLYTGPLAGFSALSWSSINFNNMVVFTFNMSRVTSEVNAIGRVQLKTVSTEGALGAKGIGIRVDNFALYGESYGDGPVALVSLGDIVDSRVYQIKIIVYGGVRAEWWVDGTFKAAQTVATKIPYGLVSAYLVSSILTSTSNPSANAYLLLFHPRLWVQK